MGYIQNIKLEIVPSTKVTKKSPLSQRDKIIANVSAVNNLRLDYLRENFERRLMYKQGIITNKHEVLVDPEEFYDTIKSPRKKIRILINNDDLEVIEDDEELKTFYDKYGWIINNRVNSYSLLQCLLDVRSDIVHNIKHKEDMPTIIDYLSDVYNYYKVDVTGYLHGKHRDIKKNKFWIPTLRDVEFVEPDRIPINNYITRLLIRHDRKTNKFYAHFYYVTDYKAIRKNVTQGVGIYLSSIPYLTLAYEDGTIKTYESFDKNEEVYELVKEKNALNDIMENSDSKISDEYHETKQKKHNIHHKIQEIIYENIENYIQDIVKDNPEYICTNRPEFRKMCNNCDSNEPYLDNYNYSNYLFEFTYYKYFTNRLVQVCEESDIPVFMVGIEYNKNKHNTIRNDYFRICSECGELDKRYSPLLNEYFECSNPECKNFGSGNQNIKYNENCAKVLCRLPFTHKKEFKNKDDKSNYIILAGSGIPDRLGYDEIEVVEL